MSVRQQALLLQAVGLLLAVFVVPGLARLGKGGQELPTRWRDR